MAIYSRIWPYIAIYIYIYCLVRVTRFAEIAIRRPGRARPGGAGNLGDEAERIEKAMGADCLQAEIAAREDRIFEGNWGNQPL